jgi:hypothetical protein
MNESEASKVKWFRGTKGTIGIAKINTEFGIEYRIGVVDGFLEHMDVQQVVAWGSKFPDHVGEMLFED